MILYSAFEHSRDRHPDQHACEWPKFVEHLRAMSKIERVASVEVKRHRCPAISPAVYDEGGRRANANVVGWGGWIGFDFDSGIAADTVLHSVDGINHVLYSSTSCTADRHKFRLILQLDRLVERDEIPVLWCGAQHLFDAAIDPACRDLARIYYAPARWMPGDLNPSPLRLFYACTTGDPLSVDDVTASIPANVQVPTLAAPVPVVYAVAGREWQTSTRILTPTILDKYCSTARGKHHVALYRLMIACAYEATRAGLAIDAADLVSCAREADQQSPVKTATTRWKTIHAEAVRALSHVEATHAAAGGGTDILGLNRLRQRANRNLGNFSGGKGR